MRTTVGSCKATAPELSWPSRHPARRHSVKGSLVASAKNLLIARLPRADQTRLLAACEVVPLAIGEVLYESQKAMRHVYFPQSGFISLIAPLDGKPVLEVGMVGSEGMLGAQLALGVNAAPLHALVQGDGSAWRIGSAAFRAELARSTALKRTLEQYLYVLMAQLTASATCLHFHQIGPRLARWLLMTHDRAGADQFHVTHEFLAYMLGVRRVGITAAAGVLQRDGLIEYHRGELKVLDRSGLEAAACGCYVEGKQAYARQLA
jgi:CRP-like cAMP-binding protein